ncbi:MAG TPA: anti-sigma factor [Gaiellales bacterium]|nr:anti-sigma factor [Gaiellales bacterium]
MSDEAELQRVERMLRRTPAPEAVPAAAAMAARNAALSEPAQVIRVSRTHRFSGWWRVASGAAALGAAAAAALVLALTSGGGGGGAFATQFSVDLHGPQGATAEVDFSRPNDGLRQMRVTTTGLPPAGAGQYYEMWFRTPSGEKVSAVTFNTADANRSSFTAVIPAGMTWHRCWVTREATDGGSTPQMILTT